MSTQFMKSGDTIVAYVDFVPHSVNMTHANYPDVLAAYKDGSLLKMSKDQILSLFSIQKKLEIASHGLITIDPNDEVISYRGMEVKNAVVERIFTGMSQGFNMKPYVRFLEKLMSNPSKTAVDELYLWLENSRLPITEDGDFLAYKKVRDDYGSYYDNGKTMNRIGDEPSMERNMVDDNRERTCSQGLHFCSWEYLPSYYGNQGRVMVVKINPANVVSIPSDYNNAKGRAWTYKIIGEVPEKDAEFAFPKAVVSEFGIYDDSNDDDNLFIEWVNAVQGGYTTLGYSDWLEECDDEDDDDWIEWEGNGAPPLPWDTYVQVKLRCGVINSGDVEEFRWYHTQSYDDVVAYLVY